MKNMWLKFIYKYNKKQTILSYTLISYSMSISFAQNSVH